MKNNEPPDLPFHAYIKRRRPILGILTLIGGMAVIPVGVFSFLAVVEHLVALPALVLFVALIFFVSVSGVRLISLGRRMLALDAFSKIERDARPPVLYLRPFSDDDLIDVSSTGFMGINRYEDSLGKVLRNLGPLISLGRPGEKWPQTGSARLYVNDDEWQSAVEYFIERAYAIIIVVGTTSAIRWELSVAMKTVEHAKILFFIPYRIERQQANPFVQGWRRIWISKKAHRRLDRERHDRYKTFREDFFNISGIWLPDSLNGAAFIDFTAQNEPRLLETIRPSILYNIGQLSLTNATVGINFKKTLKPFVAKFALYN